MDKGQTHPTTNPLKSFLDRIIPFISQKCYPNPKFQRDLLEHEVSHRRNISLIAIQAIMIIIAFPQAFLGADQLKNYAEHVFVCILNMIFVMICSRYHPEVLRVSIQVFVFLIGPIVAFFNGENVYKVFLAALVIPVIIYIGTGSIWHSIINAAIQVIFLSTIYKSKMRKFILETPPEELLDLLTSFACHMIVVTIIHIISMHSIIKNTLYRAYVANKEKEEAQRQKVFLLGFSHELRNLLNSLMGNVKLAHLEEVSEKAKDLLLNAEVCAELLLHSLNNILDTGKVEVGDLEINLSPVKIYDSLERMWSVCSELIKRKNLKGFMRVHKSIPQMLNIDRYRLFQMLLNLVGNAVKYTDAGTVDISVEWIKDVEEVDDKCFEDFPSNQEDEDEEGLFEKQQALNSIDTNFFHINFANKKLGREGLPHNNGNIRRGVLKIIISDTGTGINKQDIGRLFQKFSQVSADPSRRKLGTGLGLFITKELCERMGGQIRVYSKFRTGSAFVICLPVNPVSSEGTIVTDRERMKAFLQAKKLKTMVVDDQPFSLTVLKDFLTKLHVEVVDVAENGLDAYEKFVAHLNANNPLQVVTMDLDMPIMSGKASAEKIRNLERDRNLNPCLMMIVSGNCSESEINECLDKRGRVKADVFLKKPVNIDELCQVIVTHFKSSNSAL